MSDGVHLLIPFAASRSGGGQEALRTLSLPNLEKLLARLAPVADDPGEERSLSMPHERALARLHGIDAADGQLPLAAWQAADSGLEAGRDAWAWITPCHWRVGRDHIAMAHPQSLQLDPAASQAHLEVVQPYFEQDGITLHYAAPAVWLARGEVFRGLPTASIDRVAGRMLDTWMPRSDQARPLRRLQQEMQMLLYTHPLTDERVGNGLLPVNSFWVSGTGALPARSRRAPAGLRVVETLRAAALQEDWAAWTAAWQALDAAEMTQLAAALDSGRLVTVTLAGERGARTWSSNDGGLWRRMSGIFRRSATLQLLEPL